MKLQKIFLILILIIVSSCSTKEKTDNELLIKDKKELVASLDSYKVTTYKFGKILIRASAEKDTVSTEFKAFKADLDRIFKKVMKYGIENNKSLSVLDYISIYRDYKKMQKFIHKTDEDVFPTLSDSFRIIYKDSTESAKEIPYAKGKEKEEIQNIEHAILSAIVLLSKDLGKEISLYECSKTKPTLLPDSEIKTLLQYYRGFLFFEKGLYYLSEEEITKNIDWLNQNQKVDLPYTRAMFKWGNLNNEQTHIGFHSLNHLFRGFDRLMMEREIDEKRALEDFEVFISDSKKIGVDNEIIWSIETYLYLKHEEKDKAIASLTKLKKSKILTEKDRKGIDESIVYLENRETGKVLNGFYDKYFLSKIATKYMLSVLEKVNWQKILEDQGVPHTEEMFITIEKFKDFIENMEAYTSKEKLKEVGEDLKKEGKNLWNKANELIK